MKILVVIPTVYGGGAEQVATVLCRTWSLEHTVRVLAWNASGEVLDFGVPVVDCALGAQSGLWRKLRNIWRRVRIVQRHRREFVPDVVFAFMDEAGIPCSLAAWLEGWQARLVVSVHHNPQWIAPFRRALLAAVYRWPASVVAVSEGVRAHLARVLFLPAARLRHIPNPLVLSDDSVDVVSAQHAEGIARGCILAVGRLDVHTKGLDVLLAAYKRLPAGRPPLVIVGDGPGRTELEKLMVLHALREEVTLVGWVRDPRPFYRKAGVFVLASRYEGWSNVLMEAMGEGCIVVATRCPYGPPEILGDDLSRWLVAPNDARALADGMQSALTLAPEERDALSVALRARVQRFAADKVAAQWIDLARSLSGGEAA